MASEKKKVYKEEESASDAAVWGGEMRERERRERKRERTLLDVRKESFEVGHQVPHSHSNSSRTQKKDLYI